MMNAVDGIQGIEGLSECIERAIQEHLARSNLNITWPQVDELNHPVLRFEAFLEEAGTHDTTKARSERVASVRSYFHTYARSYSQMLRYSSKF
jgi:ATP-dependent RNA helicase DDX49/DBP8